MSSQAKGVQIYGTKIPSGAHGKTGQPTALDWDAPMRALFIALNNEVILPWSEPAKNWDRCLEQYKPAFLVNGRNQG